MSTPLLMPQEYPATTLPAHAIPFSYQWPPAPPPRRWRFWSFVALTAALWLATLALGVYLVAFHEQSVAPPTQRRIDVLYHDAPQAFDTLRAWTVQDDGRAKPFDTFARETVLTITGRERFEDNDPVAVVAAWVFLHERDRPHSGKWENYPFLLCDHHELRQLIYCGWLGSDTALTEEQQFGKYLEPAALRHSNGLRDLLQSAAARQQENSKARLTTLETKAQELKKRLVLYDRVCAGGQEGRERIPSPGALGIVALDRQGATWFSLRAVQEYAEHPEYWDEMMAGRRMESPSVYAGHPEQPLPRAEVTQLTAGFRGVQQSYRAGDAAAFANASQTFHAEVEQTNQRYRTVEPPATTRLELWFNACKPFRTAWIVSLCATLALAVHLGVRTRWARLARGAYLVGLLGCFAALGCAAAGFYCRVTLSGRPPVSNMYESVLWVACIAAVFGLALEAVQRRGVSVLAGTLLSTFGLLLADFSPLTLSASIQPLQAVLRSNYWLVIHVLTIVSSYAAFALAWGLGNFTLGLIVFAPERREQIKTLAHFCYRAIQIGVVLLAAGTLLGGFWAAESWGRFWGWDPKEVWALIALLCYLIPLHARYVGWVRELGLAIASVVCFSSIVMAWYGVNFILGAGLHSYGFGGGNDLWIYWGGLLNLALVALAVCRTESVRPTALQLQ